MLYIVFYPTRTCGRTMSVNIEHVLPCINKVIIIIIIMFMQTTEIHCPKAMGAHPTDTKRSTKIYGQKK